MVIAEAELPKTCIDDRVSPVLLKYMNEEARELHRTLSQCGQCIIFFHAKKRPCAFREIVYTGRICG